MVLEGTLTKGNPFQSLNQHQIARRSLPRDLLCAFLCSWYFRSTEIRIIKWKGNCVCAQTQTTNQELRNSKLLSATNSLGYTRNVFGNLIYNWNSSESLNHPKISRPLQRFNAIKTKSLLKLIGRRKKTNTLSKLKLITRDLLKRANALVAEIN